MKRLLTICILLLSLTFTSYASGGPIEKLSRTEMKEMNDGEREVRVALLESRVGEIKSLDPDQLSRAERRKLKKELRDITGELKAHGDGGLYISASGVILILLLIILL